MPAQRGNEMTAKTFEDLQEHYGHDIVIAQYTNDTGIPMSFAVECNDCSKSLLDFDREEQLTWSELSELTHETQVAKFNFCSCEDNEGQENPYTDCPKTGE
jgi:hypothetical protein